MTITRPVCGRSADTYSACSGFSAGALSLVLQIFFFAVFGDRQAIDRADVETGIAFDAQIGREYGLHVAIQAALDFLDRLLDRKPEFDFDIEFLEALLEVDVRHQPREAGL